MTKKAYVLYIEDERPTIRLVCEMLKIAGYEAAGAASGEEGLTMMRQRKPDLLLLDLMMPGTSGFDVYEAMKQDEKLANVPVIVISAKVPERSRIIVEGLPPVDDYITKPFDMKRLTRAVKRFV